MELTDDEIRIKIAELKGWMRLKSNQGLSPSGQPPYLNHAIYLPDWTKDPAAALELVDEMPYFSMRRFLDHWSCQAAHCGNPMDHLTELCHVAETEPYYRCGCRFGDGADFCHAVCNAYIAWMEAK